MEEYDEIWVNDEGDWEKARSPTILYSGGLGPCIAVALYNPNKKEGYMWHCFQYTDSLEEMLQEATKNPADTKRIKAWARGGALISPSTDESQLDIADATHSARVNRHLVSQILEKYLPQKNIDIKYTDEPWQNGDITLYTKTGEIEEDYNEDDIFGDDDFEL